MAFSALAAGIGAIGSIAGGAMAKSGAQQAAETSAAAADRSAQLQMEQYRTTRSDLAPFAGAGQAATNRLMQIFGLTGQQPIAQPVASAAPVAAATTGAVAAPSGVPQGYTYIPPRGGSGEGDTGFPGMLLDSLGNIVTIAPTREDALVSAGLIANPNTNIMPQPAPVAQPVAPAGATAPVSAGALPGPGSLTMPYAPPNGGVFAPEGGSVFRMDEASLRATPGYQFALREGLRAVDAANAARGSLFSGRGLQEAARYATGLADQTYGTQAAVFNDNYNRQANAFGTNLNASVALNDQYYGKNINPLFQIATLGANAAAQTGQIGQAAATSAGQQIGNAGVTSALAGVAGSRALSTGINQGVNNLLYAAGQNGWFNNPWEKANEQMQTGWTGYDGQGWS
jgi:hypothetical protein